MSIDCSSDAHVAQGKLAASMLALIYETKGNVLREFSHGVIAKKLNADISEVERLLAPLEEANRCFGWDL